MTWSKGERLYHRLPEVYRRRDLEQGEPLRALLSIVESQLERIEDDIAGLYENWFIETCEEWAVPYLADLLGLGTLGQPPLAGVDPRVQVARALDYRRHKGTPAILERVSHDVTGWFARVVELFSYLAQTQNVGHVRPGQGGLFDVRKTAAVARADDPFAPPELFRTLDLRRIAGGRRHFNIPNLALYVWRLQAYPIADSPAAPAPEAGGYLFDPLGRDVPLFNRPRVPADIVRSSNEADLPVPLRRQTVAGDIGSYYGAAQAFEIRVNGEVQPASSIAIADLTAWTPPSAKPIAVDPEHGRILFATPPAAGAKVRVSYLYGFAADLGGGPYDRRATLAEPGPSDLFRTVLAAPPAKSDSKHLADALADWAASKAALGVIRVLDSDLYEDDIDVAIPAGRQLILEAADGTRPVLRPKSRFRITGNGPTSGFTLNGFLVDAGIEIDGSLDLLVTHSTLVPAPGRQSLAFGAGDPTELKVAVTFSIVGALGLPGEIASLSLADSILDAASSAGGATPLPALLSGPLTEPLHLGRSLEVAVAFGGRAARTAALSNVPTTIQAAAQLLQAAIRTSATSAGSPSPDPAFANAVVLPVGGQLLVRSGTPGESVAVAATAADAGTARELDLLAPRARSVSGLFSGDLSSFPRFNPPQVQATLGGVGPRVVTLTGSWRNLDDLASDLGQALRAAVVAEPVFAGVQVTRFDDRLLILPGVPGAAADFAATAVDPSTAGTLHLEAPEAMNVQGVFSGANPPLAFPAPEMDLTLDSGAGASTVRVRLTGDLASQAEIAAALQNGIAAAAPAPANSPPLATVLLLGDRVLVQPRDTGKAVAFQATPNDSQTVAALSLTQPPAELLGGLLGAPLTPFPAFALPQLTVGFDAESHTLTLPQLPADLGAARTLLEQTLEALPGAGAAFAAAQVLLLGDRLLVRSGTGSGGMAVTVQPAAADPTTAGDLGFTSTLAEPLAGLLGSPVTSFPTFTLPAVNVSFGGGGGGAAVTAPWTGFPRSLSEAAVLLQEALRDAGNTPSFTLAQVAVASAGDRLLVFSGSANEIVKIQAAPGDALTAVDLGLVAPAAQPATGLLSGSLFPFPVLFQPMLLATIGTAGPSLLTLSGVPAGVADARQMLETALQTVQTSSAAFTQATVATFGNRLLVSPGIAGLTVVFQAAPGDSTSVGNLALSQSAARTVQGLFSGDLASFPSFTHPQVAVTMTVSGTAQGPVTALLSGLPADLDKVAAALQAAIRAASGNAAFTGTTVARFGSRLLVQPGSANTAVTVATAAPDTSTAADLKLTATSGAQVLLSGDLSAFPVLPLPQVAVKLGAEGPHTATLTALPADLASAATLLQAAIQSASAAAGFAGAAVKVQGDKLLVQSGTVTEAVTITPTAADPTTAAELKLDAASATAQTGGGLLSGSLAPFPALSAAPAVSATLAGANRTIAFTTVPASLAAARSALEAALQAAQPAAPAFSGASVQIFGNQLLVQPGGGGGSAVFADLANRPTTATALRLTAATGALQSLLSADLTGFTGLTLTPQIGVTLGSTVVTARLDSVPADLPSAATLLQSALRASSPAPTFQTATVEVIDTRLLVTPGIKGDAVAFSNPASGPQTASLLALTAGTGAQAVAGLLSASLPQFTVPSLAIKATIATTDKIIDLAVGTPLPATVPALAARLQARLQAGAAAGDPFFGVQVFYLPDRLVVLPGRTGDRVGFSAVPTSPGLVSRLGLDAASSTSLQGLLSSPVAGFTGLRAAPALDVTFAGGTPVRVVLGLPHDLDEAALLLEAGLRRDPAHPDVGRPANFAGARVRVLGQQLLVTSGTSSDTVTVADTPSGTATATLLGLAGAGAQAASGLLAAPPFPRLSAIAPQLSVRLGASGGGAAATASLALPAFDLASARASLEAALRAAGTGSSFTGARVRILSGRQLLVLSGNPGEAVAVTTTAADATTAAQLGLTTASRPIAGVLSGSLTPFPNLGASPAVNVTLGAAGPFVLSLAPVPASLEQARALLEAAIREAGEGDSFTRARVHAIDDQLLVLSGVSGEAVTIAEVPGSSTAATALKLTAATAAAASAKGLLGGDTSAFTGLAVAPRLRATIDGKSALVTLADLPQSLDQARALFEPALRGADPSFANASVRVLGDRLWVGSGASVALSFADALPGPTTATLLGLTTGKPGGLLSGPLPAALSGALPAIQVTLGGQGPFVATLPQVPADLAAAGQALQAAIRATGTGASFRFAQVQVVGSRLLVTPGNAADAVAFAAAPGRAGDLARLALDPASLVPADGLLSGPIPSTIFPHGLPSLHLQVGAKGYDLTLGGYPADLPQAAVLLASAIQAADPSLASAAVEAVAQRLRVELGTSPGALGTTFSFSGTAAAAGGDASTVAKLLLDPAHTIEADGLLSGDRASDLRFGGLPQVGVQIGDEGPFPATLSSFPATVADLRALLEAAIRAAHDSPAFYLARVVVTGEATGGQGERLAILPGRAAPVTVSATAGDPTTARKLALAKPAALEVGAVLSGPLSPPVQLTAAAPKVHAMLTTAAGAGESFDANFSPGAPGLLDAAALAADLQGALRHGTTAAAQNALVAVVSATDPPAPGAPVRLLALPGADGFSLAFSPGTGDLTTAGQLGLTVGRAIGSASGSLGPPLALERVTVLGRIDIQELRTASAVLFTEPVTVERQNVGCVRYSYVPDTSETPRRFRSQPDLSLALAVRQAIDQRVAELGLVSVLDLPPGEADAIARREKVRVLSRLAPQLTSTRLGDPGYAQLAPKTAPEILTGADNGSEIGAFNLLFEPLRRHQLATLIEEYLRSGLDAGIFFVT